MTLTNKQIETVEGYNEILRDIRSQRYLLDGFSLWNVSNCDITDVTTNLE